MAVFTLEDDLAPFHYDDLDLSQRHVRALQIQPGDDEAIVECTLSQQPLTSRYHYLSYTRSSEPESQKIIVNGAQLAVSDSLWAFLRSARRCHFIEPIYIDTVCIDRHKTAEKILQANLLHEIIKNAQSTIVWLGLTDTQCTVLASITPNANSSMYFKNRYRSWMELARPYEEPLPSNPTEISAKLDYSLFEKADKRRQQTWQEMLDVLNFVEDSLYWSHAQTVPEIILSQRVEMLSPTGLINLRDMFGYTSFAEKPRGLRRHRHGAKGDMRMLLGWQEPQKHSGVSSSTSRSFPERRQSTPLSVHQLLSFERHRTCLDNSDRVYSALTASEYGPFTVFNHASNSSDLEVILEAVQTITKAREEKPISLSRLVIEVAHVVILAVQCLEMLPFSVSEATLEEILQSPDRNQCIEAGAIWTRSPCHSQDQQDGEWQIVTEGSSSRQRAALCVRFTYLKFTYWLEVPIVNESMHGYITDKIALSEDPASFPLFHQCRDKYWGREVKCFANGFIEDGFDEFVCRCEHL